MTAPDGSRDPRNATREAQQEVALAIERINATRNQLGRSGGVVSAAVLRRAMEDFERDATRIALAAREAIEILSQPGVHTDE